MTKKISVVVGTRNRDKNLTYLIQSLLDQDFDINAYEIIIVNYGGESATQKLVERYGSPLINYLYVNEKGIYNEGRAKNIGVRKAKGEVIICTNADIIFAPNVLKEFYQIYLEEGEHTLYQLQKHDLKEDTQLDHFIKDVAKNNVPSNLFSVHGHTGQGDFQATHRDNWFKVRGYDEKMSGWGGMDIDLSDRMKTIGVSQYWMDPEKIRIFHQYHTIRAPSKNLINFELKKFNTTPQVNDSEWGLPERKKKQFLIINEYEDKKDVDSVIKKIGSTEDVDYCVILKNEKGVKYIPEAQSTVIIDDYKNTRDFFQKANRLASESGADTIIEIDHLHDFTLNGILEGTKLLETYDCVFMSNFQQQNSFLNYFSRLLFKCHTYFDIRIFNSRISTVLSHKKMISSNYFYPVEVYNYCRQLEQSIKEIEENTEHVVKVCRARILLELATVSIKKLIGVTREKIGLLSIKTRSKIHIILKKSPKVLTVVLRLKEGIK